jgi:tetratricopeptide (TPR) repeat protein
LVAEGKEHQSKALEGIEEGIARLGPLVVLQSTALDLEVQLRRYDNALARLDRIASQARRQESWLARRGDILRQAGRPEEAQAAFALALAAIDKLAPAQRNVPAIQDLRTRLRSDLDELRAASQNGTKQPGPFPGK